MPFVHPNSLLVVTINGVGLVFEDYFLCCHYADNNAGTAWHYSVVGIICDIFNVMMYVSPLTIMAKVIKTKSVKYMPFWLSLTNFLNGVCWTTYALIHPLDLYVLIRENNDDDDEVPKTTGVPVSEC
ncbi:unnamed protein product [Sphenostylis stenocarpa]|uniref:Uncharacterized protein n=1 Tax=Sphenostylis stenocarpa TaxID=92480 RepID=A0AA86VQD4_9FABA|nr:unnamed protein product [Sphenostylis stenocarpa]